MSTVSGLYPNAITPTVSPFGDLAQRAQQRRDNDAAVFAPVEQAQSTASGQNRPDRRQDPNTGVVTTPGQSATDDTTANQSSNTAQQTAEGPVTGEASAFERQRDEASAVRREAEQRQLDQELQTIRELSQRDREVRSHEQAHQAVGGQYTGGMTLSYERGPDGRRYAVAGEVSIDISPVPGNPTATLAKAEQVRRAALAPAEPSAQDRSVAAAAMQLKTEAQIELRQVMREEGPRPAEEEREEESAGRDRGTAVTDSARPEAVSQLAASATEPLASPTERGSEERTRALLDSQYQAQSRANMLGRQLDFMV
jgi:hypothetical protein